MIALVLCLALQQPERPRLDQRDSIELGFTEGVALAPGGARWVVSRDGQLACSRDAGESWATVELDAEVLGRRSPQLEGVAFFDAWVGVLAGYLKGRALRSEDGGATWSSFEVPIPWVYDVQVLDARHGWMVGSSGAVLATRDAGGTWSALVTPFDGVRRPISVNFESAQRGVVGGMYALLCTTDDGGDTWHTTPTPAHALEVLEPREPGGSSRRVAVGGLGGGLRSVPVPEGPRTKVERVRAAGEWLVLKQDVEERSGVWVRARDDDEAAWEAFLVGHGDERRPVRAFEVTETGWVVVDDESRVWRLDRDLEPQVRIEPVLGREVLALAARGDDVLFGLRDQRVAQLTGAALEASLLFRAADAAGRSWTLEDVDRGLDGTLYGTSTTHFFRLAPGATRWERLAALPGSGRRIAAFAGPGEEGVFGFDAALWTEAGGWRALPWQGGVRAPLWRTGPGAQHWLVRTVSLQGPALEGLFKRGTHAPPHQGPGVTGLLYSSLDGGRTWRELLRVDEHLIDRLALRPARELLLELSDDSLRAGRWITTSAGEQHFQPLPAPEIEAGVALFPDSRELPLGDGWCRLEGEALVWRDAAGERELRRFEQVESIRLDAAGALLVRVPGDVLWTYDLASATWEELRLP